MNAIDHLRKLLTFTPWASDFETGDWCQYCLVLQEEYGPKPWTGHEADCPWLLASEWLAERSDVVASTASEDSVSS